MWMKPTKWRAVSFGKSERASPFSHRFRIKGVGPYIWEFSGGY